MREAIGEQIRGLKARADEDWLSQVPAADRDRHRLDLVELGIRVSLTRARYPNQADGTEMYAVTLSRIDMKGRPDTTQVAYLLAEAFGDVASQAAERPAGQLIRMFRVPVTTN